MNTTEIECRFLEIDKKALIKKLKELEAKDDGEVTLEEIIVYDPELKWREEQKFVRIRKSNDSITLTFKEHSVYTVDGTVEVELKIDDFDKAEIFIEKIGLMPYRRNQKKRHTFRLDNVTIDIDAWPKIPTYVELEGNSEQELKKVAEALGLDWKDADFHNARWVIENIYNIPVSKLRWFTFERQE